ncbi:MAG: hypothetical protein IJ220_03375 [Clostridia bacterium]|nr:hypothetical protein [Clostridia bacterium]
MSEEETLAFIPGTNDDKEIIEKFLSVALPVKVTPSVDVKPVKAETCGRPIITSSRHGKCELGNKDGDCEFTIIQKMKIEIPVRFKVKTDMDDPFVDCEVKRYDDSCNENEENN